MGGKFELPIELIDWLPESPVFLIPILIAVAGWWSIAGLRSPSSDRRNSESPTATRCTPA